MTDQVIDEAPQTEIKNPEALLKKNRELLRELTEAKTALQASQEALAGAQGVNQKLTDDLRTIRIEDPLNAIVASLTKSPGLMMRALKDLFDVELDENNKPVLLNKEGQPLTYRRPKGNHGYTEEVAVTMDRESIFHWIVDAFEGNPDGPAALLPKAQGTGALGSTYTGQRSTQPRAATPTPQAAPVTPLGLR